MQDEDKEIAYYTTLAPKNKLLEIIRGYDVYPLPDTVIPEIRKLLLPRPALNVIIFMCIGLGKKEKTIVATLRDDFDIFPIGVDIQAGTEVALKSTDEFPVIRTAYDMNINRVLSRVDKSVVINGIVVGFNMMEVDKIYRNKHLIYYNWPTIYNVGPDMVYGKTWADYLNREDVYNLGAREAESKSKPKSKPKGKKKKGLR